MKENPFVIAGKIEPKYFCDRIEESASLINYLENRNNVVMVSPRRMGKTGLIVYCLDKPEIRNQYITIFVDILQTTSLKEFTFLLGKATFDTLMSRSKKLATGFLNSLKSINAKFSFDPATNSPVFSLGLGDISEPEYTLEDIFGYLSGAHKRCIVAIDEFQQIANYHEKNVEALLRTKIQHSSNCNFIFAGSQRHILQQMFMDYSRPFYQSASFLVLEAIPKDIYVDFAIKNFSDNHKTLDRQSAEAVYDYFQGYTYYLQRIFNRAYSITEEGETCNEDLLRESLHSILGMNEPLYREIMANIPLRQKELLIAVSKNDIAEGITSADFIKDNGLASASSVQAALRKMLETDMITKNEGKYSVSDKFLSLWINKIYGTEIKIF